MSFTSERSDGRTSRVKSVPFSGLLELIAALEAAKANLPHPLPRNTARPRNGR